MRDRTRRISRIEEHGYSNVMTGCIGRGKHGIRSRDKSHYFNIDDEKKLYMWFPFFLTIVMISCNMKVSFWRQFRNKILIADVFWIKLNLSGFVIHTKKNWNIINWVMNWAQNRNIYIYIYGKKQICPMIFMSSIASMMCTDLPTHILLNCFKRHRKT